MSGNVAKPGNDIRNAIELARGDNSKKVNIIYEDSECNPTKAVSAYSKLVEVDKVKVVIGALCSQSTLAIAPLAEKDKTILITPASAAESISKAGDYIFRNHTKDSDEAKKLAEFAISHNFNKVAIMYAADNDAMVQRKGYLADEFKRLNGEVALTISFLSDSRNFHTELTKIKNKEAVDAIFALAPNPAVASRIVKQSSELGINKQIFGDKSWVSSDFLNSVGNLAEGIIFAEAEFKRTYSPEFWDRYKVKFGEEPPSWAAQAYDTFNLLTEIIFDNNCGLDTDCIKSKLYQVSNYPGVSGNITFDSNGDVIKEMSIKTIKNGQFVPYEE